MTELDERFEALKYLSVAAFVVAPSGKIVVWNEAAATLLGKKASEVMGRRASAAFGPRRSANPVTASLASRTRESGAVVVEDAVFAVTAEPCLDADGEVAATVVTILPEARHPSAGSNVAESGSAESSVAEASPAPSLAPAKEQAGLSTFDDMPNPVMVVDASDDFRISYANPASLELLGRLQEHLPVSVDAIVGSSIDVFHSVPPRTRQQLADPANLPYETQFKLGPETVQLRVFARRGVDGDYLGPALSWELITKQVRLLEQSERLKAVVEHSPHPVMLLDRESLVVTYANPASLESLAGLEEYLPCRSSEIVGSKVDILHQVPASQWALLGDDKNLPCTSEIKLGPETLKLTLYALRDAEGSYIGPALSWESITAQKLAADREMQLAAEVSRVNAIVDNSPKPVMLVDSDTFDISYANRAALRLLKEVEEHLPCRASEIVGANFDIFHKLPEAQRRLLADEKNLPHRARVRLGSEFLDLEVYALLDADDKYVGPALSWDLATERVAMERADAVAREAVTRVQLALEELASGNIDERIEEVFQGELEMMKQNFNSISDVLSDFQSTCDSLVAAAREGRLKERADGSRFQGSYRGIIEGINSIMDAILEPVDNIREKLQLTAGGDLTAYVEEEYPGDHAALRDALNASLDGLNGLLGQVKDAAGQIASSSGQVSDAAQDLSQGASEQAATIEEISAQMVQMTNQTTQNAENATQANRLAVAARDGAEAGDASMREMVSAMGEIEEASNNISKIIKVIDEIAFQTNLLALNAAVEAARAGVHGKGFAVVAEEVRNLAARSARAAKETTEMIEGSIKKVAQGTGIAQDTAAALNRIVQDVGKVTDLVAEIAAASNEQAEGIQQINTGLEQVNEVTQRNTATAEESAASAQEMSGQTAEMRGMVERFKLRERSVGSSSLADLPPEMAEAVQRYMQQAMGMASPPAPEPATTLRKPSAMAAAPRAAAPRAAAPRAAAPRAAAPRAAAPRSPVQSKQAKKPLPPKPLLTGAGSERKNEAAASSDMNSQHRPAQRSQKDPASVIALDSSEFGRY